MRDRDPESHNNMATLFSLDTQELKVQRDKLKKYQKKVKSYSGSHYIPPDGNFYSIPDWNPT